MGEVIRFPKAPALPQPTTSPSEADRIQSILFKAMGGCPACGGRGWIVLLCFDGEPGRVPCPCGGDDENRVDPDEPDFDGAA